MVPSIITRDIDIEMKTKPIQRFLRAATYLPSAFKIQKEAQIALLKTSGTAPKGKFLATGLSLVQTSGDSANKHIELWRISTNKVKSAEKIPNSS
jgi:hypothetical protein